jgi:predicted transcriptional regulator
MPVKLEDLLGAMVQAEVVSARMGRLENQQCLIVSAKVGEEEVRYGILPELIDKVLASGQKQGDKVVLKLPAPNKKARITWVNVY